MKLFDLNDFKVTVATIGSITLDSSTRIISFITAVFFMAYVILKFYRLWSKGKDDE